MLLLTTDEIQIVLLSQKAIDKFNKGGDLYQSDSYLSKIFSFSLNLTKLTLLKSSSGLKKLFTVYYSSSRIFKLGSISTLYLLGEFTNYYFSCGSGQENVL